MKRYFTADLHLGCAYKLIRGMLRRYPGTNVLFKSTEDHDHHLIGAINCTVKPEDELHILGDFAELPGKYRAMIKCKHVFLTRGNHDPVMKSRNVFGDIPWMRIVKLRGEEGSLKCVLSHAPQLFWIGSHRGWGHLYGHVHGQREAWMDIHLGRERRSLDVGVDHVREEFGDYFPLDEHELYAMLTSRQGHDNPLYYDEYQEARDQRYGFD
ncbi:MAG: hypothetical protein ACYTFQ_21265 [Planctomycetota bacterium]|jgi:calcineurin-like phosphoesterase family protein